MVKHLKRALSPGKVTTYFPDVGGQFKTNSRKPSIKENLEISNVETSRNVKGMTIIGGKIQRYKPMRGRR